MNLKNNDAEILAEEAWEMLTDRAKYEMRDVKDSFIGSLSASIDHVLDKYRQFITKDSLR